MNPLFKLFGIDKIFVKFRNNPSRLKWRQRNQKLFEDLTIPITSKLYNFPPKGAVLVYANHPTGLDPYLVCSCVPREDTYFFSDTYQTKKGKEISKRIIPVYYWSLTEFIYKPLLSWPGFFIMRIIGGTYSKREAKKENEKSINKALHLLKEGNVVIIHPSGGEVDSRPWKAGLGKLIKLANEEKISMKLYETKIYNLSEVQLLWHFLVNRKYYNKENIVIVKGRNVAIKKTTLALNSFELSNYLKNEFNK